MKEELSITVHNNELHWHNRRSPIEVSLAKIRAKYNLEKTWPFGENRKNDVQTNVKVTDSQRKSVPSQVDILDPNDRSKDTLLFIAEVPQSASFYDITLSETDMGDSRAEENNLLMKNDHLTLKLSVNRSENGYLAGSAHEVKMNSGVELTNPFGIDNIIADITKKAMQVEEIWVTPPWDPTTTQHWYLPDQDYEYVNYNEGPVRQSLTIRAPFELRFENPLRSGPGKIFNRYHCYLYRVISLYRGKYFDLGRYHINEEAFCTVDSCETVHSIDERSFKPIGSTNNLNFPLNFRTKYVMYIPHIYTKQIDTFNLIHPLPDWFVIWNNEDPMPGIGFASNCHIKNLKSYGDSIEWEMIPTWHMRNIHLFMDKTNTLVDGKHNFGNVVGSNWFNEIYTPLWAD